MNDHSIVSSGRNGWRLDPNGNRLQYIGCCVTLGLRLNPNPNPDAIYQAYEKDLISVP